MIFFETPVTPSSEREFGKHPTQKPVQLMEKFVKILTNKNDIVFDPFMGSGSSGVASLLNDRKFIGSDINPEYCKMAEKRLLKVIKNANEND